MARVSTGVRGLDRVLNGGFLPNNAYLVRGGPGKGKTTLGLHFLSVAASDEKPLFIGFQESEEQVRKNAESIGLDPRSTTFLNLSPDEQFFTQQEKYDVFAPSEVEQAPLSQSIVEVVEKLNPRRVFVDSLTQLRFLNADVFQYRKEVLSFLHFLKSNNATILFSSEHSSVNPDDDLQFLADGVISFEDGEMGQEVEVSKFRGSDFIHGRHQMRNQCSGLEVFPRPVPPKEEEDDSRYRRIGTGVDRLDELLGGGLESGTITLVSGPSGVGKSTLGASLALASAQAGRNAVVYLFEEEVRSYLYRAEQLRLPMKDVIDSGRIHIEQVEPMRYLADEFIDKIYRDIEQYKARLVVIDSTAGFDLTLAEVDLKPRLHSLAKSLARINISVVLINETSSLYGDSGISEKGISYLSDNVLMLNYQQRDQQPVNVIGVVKKRLGDFDKRLHEFEIGPYALSLNGVYRP